MPPGTPHADDACGHRPGGGGVGRSNLLRQAPISRWLAARLRKNGRRVAIIPMPYSDLDRQRAQRFATLADLDSAACTVEERDEYAPHIAAGGTVFAGVDYGEIVPRAAAESDSRRIAHHAGCERRGRPARAHAEDRPTITHGTMPFGAGLVAASAVKPAAIVDPRPFAVGELGDEVDTAIVRARYEVAEVGEAGLGVLVDAWLARGAAP